MYAYIDTYNFFLSTVNTAGGISSVLLTTDSSLRRTIAKSRQKEYDFKLLGWTQAEHIVINKAEKISKQVYNKIKFNMIISSPYLLNPLTSKSISMRY